MSLFDDTKITTIIGDNTRVTSDVEIDCSEMTKFDDLEYECWYLFLKYCDELGIEPENKNKYDIDFYVSKAIQETILDIIEEAGIILNYNKETT